MADDADKSSVDSTGKGVVDDTEMVKEVEAMEDRILHDEATEDEYLVQDAYEVALKVGIPLALFFFHALTPIARSCPHTTSLSSSPSPSVRFSSASVSPPLARKSPLPHRAPHA